MKMGKLRYTVAQLNEAIKRVLFGSWADVSGVTATPDDVREGKKFVASDKILKDGTANFTSESGMPIEVKTESEMNDILNRATQSDVGKIYLYTGTTTNVYKNNELYVLRGV